MCRHISGHHSRGCMWCVEARDSAKHLWCTRQPHSPEGWAPGVKSAKGEDLTVAQPHAGPITQT